MRTRYEVGMAVAWTEPTDDPDEPGGHWGVIMSDSENVLSIVEVDVLRYGDKYFDDADAVYDRDKDNVRIRDIPPFMMLSIAAGDSGCCAFSNPDEWHHITYEDAEQYDMNIIDEGYLVSDRDMNLILHHPWPKQMELERKHDDAASIADLLSGTGISFPVGAAAESESVQSGAVSDDANADEDEAGQESQSQESVSSSPYIARLEWHHAKQMAFYGGGGRGGNDGPNGP